MKLSHFRIGLGKGAPKVAPDNDRNCAFKEYFCYLIREIGVVENQ
jgi:hypothetical protein